MDITPYLKLMAQKQASDLYLTTGAPISARVNGQIEHLTKEALRPGITEQIAYELMNEVQIAEFKTRPEMNFAFGDKTLGRFRANVFKQRSQVGIVIRHIKTNIPEPQSLGLPPVVLDLVMRPRGLVLIVGATGSGKSTTVASLIDHRNTNSHSHIITIEDPIEYTHHHKQSIVNQREVGFDTNSYDDALRNALRQSPDVILIGEIRTRATMEQALSFAETGHLCVSTMHATNANQALDRIVNFFPKEQQHQLYLDLSLNMEGIVSQRLVQTNDGGRTAAIEVLLGTPRVRDLIRQGKIDEIKSVMESSTNFGMRTFDQALLELCENNVIGQNEALKHADSQNNLNIKIKYNKDQPSESYNSFLELEETDKTRTSGIEFPTTVKVEK